MERSWAMPNMATFSIKPIKKFVEAELASCELVIDPFARESRVADITNDINPAFDTDYNIDALEFLQTFEHDSVDAILFDPPYSLRQLKECYNGIGNPLTQRESRQFYSDIKKEIARVVRNGGKVLSFGWNSGGIGKNLGFELTHVLLVPHGGPHHDTICVSEMKR